jgi:hypothetical protein
MKRFAILLTLGAAALSAQTTALSFRTQVGSTVQTLGDTGTISFNAEAIGRPLDGTVTVTNRSTNSISVTRVEITGTTDFTATGIPDPASVFTVNEGFGMTIRFRPASGQRVVGAVRFFFSELPAGRPPINGTATLNLVGTTPEFVLSYLPPPSANATPIQSGGTIPFPATAVNETSSAVVVITNRGSGAGTVGEIAATGASFSLASLPSPPTTVESQREVRFSIRYAPTVIEQAAGTVRIEFVDRTVSLNLTGSSTGALYTYELLSDNAAAALARGATITIPDAAVGERNSITVRVRNTGNADGRITALGVQGAGFTLTDQPFLPATLTPGGTATVQVTFTPTAPGRFTGRLRIGDDSFDVVSNGLGPNLTYSFVAGPVTTTIVNNGTITFPPAAVGGTSTVRVVISNNGTLSSAVNSVSIVPGGTAPATTFVSATPALPATIQPNGTFAVTLTFAPLTTGTLTGTLRIDSQTFNLTGIATAPPNLPAYSFSGAAGAQQPASQLSVGLALAQAYPLTLRGVLTLGFNSEVFANDPAVQFALGGRTVNFTIPAGQREAVFPTNQSTVRLQTGTVAGTMVLTPSFTTDAGLVLTPADPPPLTLTVAPGAPRLLSAQLTGRTATGYSLLVTGWATSRQISTIDITITPTSGENVTTQRISIPADASFTAWYASAASAQFGSQFTATIPLTITGDVTNVTALADTIQSVGVTLTNRVGSSQSITASAQ